jgi:hypothetical protein
MQITTLSENILPDGVIRYLMEIPSGNFLYVGFLLESFEGICLYTTPDRNQDILQIDVVPDYKEEFQDLLAAIREFEIPPNTRKKRIRKSHLQR